jgi:hypothetical protein
MEAYLKGLEQAKLKSKQEQDKLAKEKADAKAASKNTDNIIIGEPKLSKEEKRKAYDEAMRKITELVSLTKYADAIALLPSVADYPEKAAELQKKSADLNRQQAIYLKLHTQTTIENQLNNTSHATDNDTTTGVSA